MTDPCPGLNRARLVRLIEAAVQRCKLDLSGRVIVTEAATGAYVVTPIIAALAGAKKVFALAVGSRHGSVREVMAETNALAKTARVGGCVQIVTRKTKAMFAQADIITNSGHVRPIDRKIVRWMKPSAVIPLMYEAWELRSDDVDLQACRDRGIQVVGTNERHPNTRVFDSLGVMAVKLSLDAGISLLDSRILLLCDNPFRSKLVSSLRAFGARVDACVRVDAAPRGACYDVVLVALTPREKPVLGKRDAVRVHKAYPGVVVVQFVGDVDRKSFKRVGVPVWPVDPPPAGHMGILPSAVGPEVIVRLQAGGLKAGEVALKKKPSAKERAYIQKVKFA